MAAAPPELDLTPEFSRALDLLEGGRRNLFITGRAGTGKSTLLQHFRSTTRKNIAVLAPTGVAAINVGGETIHSFFGFKPDVTPDRVRKVNRDRQELYRKIDAVVIDEVSMVRSDLLDSVERFLTLNGKAPERPFGGVQMVAFGDLYQLPPVVAREERELFSGYYESPYFFSARSFEGMAPEWIDLGKVFRQTDGAFLEILNRIRNDTASEEDLAVLNGRVREEIDIADLEDAIFLTTTNDRASAMNRQQLDRLPAKKQIFAADVAGDFDPGSYPTERELALKEGARVMLLNNDSLGRWVNGTLAKITKIEAGRERLIVTLPGGEEEELRPFRWDMFRFQLDRDSQRLVPVPVGEFTQFPVRLAWAITIHKSQGLTFDKVVLDLWRGTFAHGQLYVALSRLRSLSGLILTCPVQKSHILLDRRIQKFVTGYQVRLSEARSPVEEKLAAIREAIESGRDLEIVYLNGSDEKSSRRVTPVAVSEMQFQLKSFLGVKAYCHSRREERVFRVDRILEMKTVERS
jgi:hypothetical protein